MGIPDLPEKDLLGVVSCKTTKSHNKVLHFRYEREGTVFFVHKKGSEYIFSMKPDRTAKQVVIKRNTYPNFLYIPVKQIISEEGDVSIYRKGKDYIVKPASEKEIQLKKKKQTQNIHWHSVPISMGSYFPRQTEAVCMRLEP